MFVNTDVSGTCRKGDESLKDWKFISSCLCDELYHMYLLYCDGVHLQDTGGIHSTEKFN